MSMDYMEFLQSKIDIAQDSGFEIEPAEVNPALKPHQRDAVVWAIKGGRRALFESFGLKTLPGIDDARSDIIQSVRFDTKEELVDFCKAVQSAAPIDSFVVPEPWDMPGYSDPVIMAAGAFVQGATTELSADAPIREPYIGYMQGALTFEHALLAAKAITKALQGPPSSELQKAVSSLTP